MATVRIQVSERRRDRLHEIAEREHQSVGAVVERAVDQVIDAGFWTMFLRQLDELRADPAAWRAINGEFHEFDETLLEGLQDQIDR